MARFGEQDFLPGDQAAKREGVFGTAFATFPPMNKVSGHFPLVKHIWDACVPKPLMARGRTKFSTTTILSRQPIQRTHALKIATSFYGSATLAIQSRKIANSQLSGR